jgi:hypothetical protein
MKSIETMRNKLDWQAMSVGQGQMEVTLLDGRGMEMWNV